MTPALGVLAALTLGASGPTPTAQVAQNGDVWILTSDEIAPESVELHSVDGVAVATLASAPILGTPYTLTIAKGGVSPPTALHVGGASIPVRIPSHPDPELRRCSPPIPHWFGGNVDAGIFLFSDCPIVAAQFADRSHSPDPTEALVLAKTNLTTTPPLDIDLATFVPLDARFGYRFASWTEAGSFSGWGPEWRVDEMQTPCRLGVPLPPTLDEFCRRNSEGEGWRPDARTGALMAGILTVLILGRAAFRRGRHSGIWGSARP